MLLEFNLVTQGGLSYSFLVGTKRTLTGQFAKVGYGLESLKNSIKISDGISKEEKKKLLSEIKSIYHSLDSEMSEKLDVEKFLDFILGLRSVEDGTVELRLNHPRGSLNYHLIGKFNKIHEINFANVIEEINKKIEDIVNN